MEEFIELSKCCESSVTPQCISDYNTIDAKNPSTLVVDVKYICNKCGEYTEFKNVKV